MIKIKETAEKIIKEYIVRHCSLGCLYTININTIMWCEVCNNWRGFFTSPESPDKMYEVSRNNATEMFELKVYDLIDAGVCMIRPIGER